MVLQSSVLKVIYAGVSGRLEYNMKWSILLSLCCAMRGEPAAQARRASWLIVPGHDART
jgi:hypothetical protein